jgi:two-component system NarL family sensor kinase
MQKNPNDIVIFLIVVCALILGMITFIILMLTMYRKRQNNFQRSLEQIKLDHARAMLSSKLEIQEQTFQNISREIHDNINLSLTLAKLQLYTIDLIDKKNSAIKIDTSVELLTKSIADLSDISKGLNSDFIVDHGLLHVLEDEIARIRRAGLFSVEYSLTGNPVYMDSQQELIIFRIIQEAFNNIIKHAHASNTSLQIHYSEKNISIKIEDNGVGFDIELSAFSRQAGLKNMEARTKMLGGEMKISSQPGSGSKLNFIIPYKLNE